MCFTVQYHYLLTNISDITAAAPLPCDATDTLMWMTVIEVMGLWEIGALHTIRRVLKHSSEAELQGGAPSQVRFHPDICDISGSKWNLYTTQRVLSKSKDLNLLWNLSKSPICRVEFLEIYLIPSDCIFSLRHKDSIAGHGVYILSASFETSSPS